MKQYVCNKSYFLFTDPEFSTLLASKTLLPEHPYYPDADDSNSNFTNENEIIMHMDIRESLQTLQ